MDNKLNRYQELDALRGIAAILVVLFHFTMHRAEAKIGFKLGITGVDLFFIISGFVIFMSLTKVKNSTQFIINRVSRLYPTYWACVTFTFVLTLALSSFDFNKQVFIQYLGNLTMFQLYLKIPDIDGPYWTMIVEMLFYIGILFLFHFKLTKYLNPICLTLSVVVVVLTSFFNGNIFVKRILEYIPLMQFIPLFFAGIIFYNIYTQQSKGLGNYILLFICFVCQVLLYNYSGKYKLYISHIEYIMMLTLYFILFLLFVNGKLNLLFQSLLFF